MQGEVAEGNDKIWPLLQIMSSQWLTGPSGVYGINFVPVIEAARELGINIDRRFLEKVKAYEAAAVSAVTGKKEGCTPEKKAKCLAEFGSVHLDWICKTCEEMRPDGHSRESGNPGEY